MTTAAKEGSDEMSDANMKRANWIGAPAFYDLNMACVSIRQAFPDYGPFLVGSALERRDHRDVDVRCILSRETYIPLFACEGGHARLQLLNAALSHYLARASGLPVDFQFQEQITANAEYEGRPRSALGIFGGEPARPMKPAEETLPTRQPVCSTCNDTHEMPLTSATEERLVMCTHCPTPCQSCRAGGNGPYCERTPCSCSCHRPKEAT